MFTRKDTSGSRKKCWPVHFQIFFRILAFILTLGVLLFLVSLIRPADRVLAYFEADGNMRETFTDLEALSEKQWTSLEQTTYQNGTAVSSARFHRIFPTRCEITQTRADGQTTHYLYIRNGEQVSHIYQLSDSAPIDQIINRIIPRDPIIRCDDQTDPLGRLIRLNTFDADGTQLNMLEFTYYDTDTTATEFVKTQRQQLGSGASSCLTYDYADSQVSQSTLTTGNGAELAETTHYTYEGRKVIIERLSADGSKTGKKVISVDFIGRPTKVEVYGPDEELVSQIIYRYRFWEFFTSNIGIFFLLIALSLSLSVAVSLQFQKKESSPEK